MKILMTGATSFLGLAAAERLLRSGHEIYAPVREGSARRPLLRCLEQEGLRVFSGDLSDSGAFREACLTALPEGADLCLHFGWGGVGVRGRMDPKIQAENVRASLSLLELCKELSVRRFLFSGSQAEYGMTLERVKEENLTGPFDEKTPCRPVSEYGKGKLKLLKEGGSLAESLGIRYVHMRIFSVYGPGDHGTSLVETCVRAAGERTPLTLGPCRQIWNFLHIRDFAKACALLCEAALPEPETRGLPGEIASLICNVGSNETEPLRAFAEEIFRTAGRDPGEITFEERPAGPEGTPYLDPDTGVLKRLTGFSQEVSFREGITEMLRENP